MFGLFFVVVYSNVKVFSEKVRPQKESISIPDTASGYLQFVDGCLLTIEVFWQGFLLTTKLCLSD